jgi:hypothetical protein
LFRDPGLPQAVENGRELGEVRYVAQRQRISHVHHHNQTDATVLSLPLGGPTKRAWTIIGVRDVPLSFSETLDDLGPIGVTIIRGLLVL